jgi:hypothetical protein
VIVCATFDTTMLFNASAPFRLSLPAWLARSTTVPPPVSVTFAPAIVAGPLNTS